MVTANITGQMEPFILANSPKGFDKEKGHGLVRMVINMLGILAMIEKMGLENIFGPMEIDTKDFFHKI